MPQLKTDSLFHRIWRHRHFYLFISPFFILFAIFGLYPLLFSLYLSFVEWDGLTDRKWVGLLNYSDLLRDAIFYKSLWNTLVIGLLYIPPMFILAFLFAVMLNQGWLKARGFFRAAFFMPCVTPMVVIAIVFGLLYSEDKGLLNYALAKAGALAGIHFPNIKWLGSPNWSKISVAILVVWRWTGYNMVLMLAGLQGIPEEYYEAARIDGAGVWGRLRYITLPLLKPTFVFCSVMSLLGTVYMFDEVFVLTAGGPGSSTTNFGLYLFDKAFTDFRFGYASSAAYVVALVVFLMSLVLLRWRKSQ
ncbi:MAG: sugar ABC transporter permease [Candidatus Sumerlaeota bacterium]|nr:sugar ABC transporter permease [Candidatus Sumerlaeota bacterium]